MERTNNKGFESEQKGKPIKDKTFVLKIKYDQNQSVQGSIQWIEQEKIVYFRSMMELILLLNESLDKKDCRSWNGDDGVLKLIQSTVNE